MKQLARFAALVTLGGCLMTTPTWADDTNGPQAEHHATVSTNTAEADTTVAKTTQSSTPPAPVETRTASTNVKPESPPSDPLAAKVIDDSALSNARGGADTHQNQNTSTGAVTGNTASQLTTGSNTISEGSFANTSGIPIVIQNSGNNVLIQNSTILNLQLESPK